MVLEHEENDGADPGMNPEKHIEGTMDEVDDPGDIYFYGKSRGRISGAHAFLANFHKSPISIDGLAYPTVEHYFQAVKHSVTHPDLAEKIRQCPTPGKAKKLAWSAPAPRDWDARKQEIMLTGLRAKFGQNPDLARRLLETGNARLHEDAPDDMYWGVKGKDVLGTLLMKVREEIRSGVLDSLTYVPAQ